MKKIFILSTLYFLLTTLLIGCATTTVSSLRIKETVRIDGSRYIFAESLCEAYNISYHWDPIARKATLKKDDKEARFLVDSSVALLDDTVRTMDKEARFYQGSMMIPDSFARRTLAPFFREKYVARKRLPTKIYDLPIRRVVIDPGHGGKDPGAVGKRGLKEKDVVLDIAKRLKRELKAAGINAILTRESDKFISLSQRAKITNANIDATQGDFFISIHANASHSRWVSGIEVFYLSEAVDDNPRSFKAAKDYRLNLKESYFGKNTLPIIWYLLFRENRRESAQLAKLICSSLSKDLRQRNRGAKQARFYVLNTNAPAILVEVGFISNLREEEKLRDASYREKIAQALAEGVIQYNRQLSQRRYTRY